MKIVSNLSRSTRYPGSFNFQTAPDNSPSSRLRSASGRRSAYRFVEKWQNNLPRSPSIDRPPLNSRARGREEIGGVGDGSHSPEIKLKRSQSDWCDSGRREVKSINKSGQLEERRTLAQGQPCQRREGKVLALTSRGQGGCWSGKVRVSYCTLYICVSTTVRFMSCHHGAETDVPRLPPPSCWLSSSGGASPWAGLDGRQAKAPMNEAQPSLLDLTIITIAVIVHSNRSGLCRLDRL